MALDSLSSDLFLPFAAATAGDAGSALAGDDVISQYLAATDATQQTALNSAITNAPNATLTPSNILGVLSNPPKTTGTFFNLFNFGTQQTAPTNLLSGSSTTIVLVVAVMFVGWFILKHLR